MSVVMKGGTSGCRENYLAPVPSSGSAQPVQDTSTNSPVPGNIHLQAETFRPTMPQTATPDFMPTGGTDATGTDLADPGATMGGDQSVFVNTPYTGLRP